MEHLEESIRAWLRYCHDLLRSPSRIRFEAFMPTAGQIPIMRKTRPVTAILAVLLTGAVGVCSSRAIEVQPGTQQIQVALERGKAAAAARTPPDQLYARFGSSKDLEPTGFLLTKMVGLAVMSTHFALRGATPNESEVRQILDETTLLVSVTIFGSRPDFARDCYMLLVQGSRTIKPVQVRFDAQATRTTVWPNAPAYRAKIVASFNYSDLSPWDTAKLSVFPLGGGEVTFDLDFSRID